MTGARRKATPARPLAAVILAAGEGKRMRSDRAKVLHEACGRALVEHVLYAARAAGADPLVVVVGAGAGAVRARLDPTGAGRFESARLAFATQDRQRGTGDAVRAARTVLRRFAGDVLILCGDVPGLPAAALSALVRRHRRAGAALTVLTAEVDDPTGYGRIVRGPGGALRAIVEEADAGAEERAIREINTGTYCARWRDLDRVLADLEPDNAQGEYYLTDAVRLLIERGARVAASIHPSFDEALGVNSRRQLARVHRTMNRRHVERWLDRGVTILDPQTTWIEAGVTIGRDAILHPGVTLEGATRVGPRAIVRSGVRLTDTRVGAGAVILDGTVAEGATLGAGCRVGPGAWLPPGTRVPARAGTRPGDAED